MQAVSESSSRALLRGAAVAIHWRDRRLVYRSTSRAWPAGQVPVVTKSIE